jgi:hypothetical protein
MNNMNSFLMSFMSLLFEFPPFSPARNSVRPPANRASLAL